MSINLNVPRNEAVELKPRITVIGVGGAGGNAVNNMINAKLEGVDFVVANTDAQSLAFSKTDRRIQLGTGLTQGLGAGSKPEIGRAAAEETIDEINAQIKGSHMVFIAAGMGGGTGTGAAPVIARAARDLGVLTVGVVTKPFQFEGMHRLRLADKGIEELEQYVDTLIIIPNQNLFRVANEKTTFADAFKMADDVLYSGVRGVTDLMVMPGLINLDFADVRSVMSEMGKAMMGTGEAEGDRRALDAAEAAISNPLLDDSSMAGANGVLINITGGSDMTLFEVDEAANRIRSEVDEDAYIIFGSTFDDSMEGRMRVSVVATGIAAERSRRAEPSVLSVHSVAVASKPVPAAPHQAFAFEATVAQAPTEKPGTVEDPVDEPVMRLDVVVDEGVEHENAVHDDSDMTNVEAEAEFEAEVAAEAPVMEPVWVQPAPAAMPSALNEDAYIPSAPAAHTAQEEAHIDPMAEAALMNGAEVSAKPKGLSLFERVTGGAKNKVSMFGQAKSEPQAPAIKAEPTMSFGPAPKPAMRSTGGGQQALLEPTLGGLNPEERLQTSPSEDDLLDIPAFLRRQAN
ncbi:MAG: cell division protein FtsZ [Rhodospirillales bacterium]|nr:cell division protein FtsZ [Rhodospirillales bacterium]